ncbi:phosphoesterase RecJ-like protein [Parabacteroides sp. PF5-5]|uniref:DHH family phosphoesterase n=1 Tax=unclassified Parabacteroides TaxID=2649774 RepID=UPI002473439E|nr:MULTISPECIES: bifunctional oligoribonuclease/PAP phosphatase NrnA [unclassified Parabacteroides]MDH6304708.1 phosphoesterase RecJ-like protein [Parabacteroides sp. PH5-39]MDH6315677.1 phosphoesterase RecJ-like protein [Parabacteroides sp. PF5-13]MDH6319338.1 phosphoesterase RecJ-like protein [Parabacteroides sp. PH5-13]MDH6323069.1 phosphoesterase RecJ-like protein [Parabacteroides sp. PH5-8]MDH6326870.1 phosphoesterase RecJ-like protein [Parabacteroides sp. PH5-41]
MLTKIILEEQIQKAKKYIEKGDKFVVVTHVTPDGDAIGSSLGLYHFLNEFSKEQVNVVVPNDFPSFYKWMPGAKDIVIHAKYPDFAEQLIREADVIFCLDFNEPKRIERLAPAVVASDARKVMIDHHLNPADFCRVVMSYPQISSTSELVFRFICRMGLFDLINRSAAECIYTGMMTDTGAFTYNSNHPEIYTIISELLRKGIDKDAIYRKVNQVYSESRLRLMGYVLYEKMRIYPEQHTALITLSQEELDRFQYVTGDTEGFVNLPLSIDGIVFSVFIREDKDYVKVSLRSVGDFPCNEFASRYFNGGGHKNASGGEFYGSLTDSIANFEKGLNEFNPNNVEELNKHA